MTAVSLWGVGHDVVDTKDARRPVLEQISFTVARGAARRFDRSVISAPRTRSATARATARPWRR
ncbi:hypothetical protein ASE87_11015 [Frigoribacterium sp. Leaf44]|nr:hypothetical protein ASE87_11015 [Frigoribacterium sp. Leaf44]